MLSNHIQTVNDFLKVAPDAVFLAEAQAVGGGEWSLEVYAYTQESKEFMFELLGSNGSLTDEPADDLWAEYGQIMKQAGVPE